MYCQLPLVLIVPLKSAFSVFFNNLQDTIKLMLTHSN